MGTWFPVMEAMSIGMHGVLFTGKYLPIIIFTIKTKSGTITGLRTLNVLRPQGI
jgi:hypothetical protein